MHQPEHDEKKRARRSANRENPFELIGKIKRDRSLIETELGFQREGRIEIDWQTD